MPALRPQRSALLAGRAVRYKVLVADDEKDELTVYKGLLEGEGFSVVLASSGEEALDAAVESKPDLVLLDAAMPDADGADDYVIKPFSIGLLNAKIRAVLRRYAAPAELDESLKADGLVLDVGARTASQGGRRVALTRKEFDLLTTFLRKPGWVLSANYLLETVWGYDPADYNDPHTVGVHVSTLRRKLGLRLGRRIVSVPGLGYRYER